MVNNKVRGLPKRNRTYKTCYCHYKKSFEVEATNNFKSLFLKFSLLAIT